MQTTSGTTDQQQQQQQYYLGPQGDRAHRVMTSGLQKTLTAALKSGEGRLFTVETASLWDCYLSSFKDPAERQYHNCSCCRHFIRRYGGLVTVTEGGRVKSALWDDSRLTSNVPHQYWNFVGRLREYVESGDVVRQFLWKETIWGVPEAGGFKHMNVTSEDCNFEKHLTPNQAMAVRYEDRKHLEIALTGSAFGKHVTNDYLEEEYIKKAVAMLEAGGLARAETILPMGRFLLEVQDSVKASRGEQRNRILWHAVGKAARGWCTPRGSAFGALVEDVRSGRSNAAVERAQAERMRPDRYQRPQAAPAAGNVRQAEQVFDKLGLGPSLQRRFMGIEEASLFWRPASSVYAQNRAAARESNGLFSHVEVKPPKALTPPSNKRLSSVPQTMTFTKFQKDVLPKVLSMTLRVPSHGSFSAFTTAVHPEAPPILKWDHENNRNPGAWYLYTNGSFSSQWALTYNEHVQVLGLCYLPPVWTGHGENMEYQTGGRVLCILQGAHDTHNSSIALFPECLKSELHHVRATIEAHSRATVMKDLPAGTQHAAGYMLNGKNENIELIIGMQEGTAVYKIDRLE